MTSVKWNPWTETAPCSEDGGYYFVTLLDRVTGQRIVSTEWYDVDTFDYGFFDCDTERFPIIAWAECPAPYLGEIPSRILIARDDACNTALVCGQNLSRCQAKALQALGDRQEIELTEYYGTHNLVSTFNPITMSWKDVQK